MAMCASTSLVVCLLPLMTCHPYKSRNGVQMGRLTTTNRVPTYDPGATTTREGLCRAAFY
ncbi:uncharacterized protein B0H18DRAFT_1013267 [Fomitopsis serialis]|uniref:uncharacterized protein n=1 Tax=Fomitopsis serialis TaxID=139415 RepID=UPI002007CFAE|nr:uncharacterized protein B0H18DRAFT_1013267 [Neoantrodia serialis]KAH9924058.1 hypothetical protein B0H18DRAFT_1013267 [Neoantrodia serialis]